MTNRYPSTLALLVLLVLVGFAFRLYQIDDEPLRGDEGFSAQYWAGYPLDRSLSEIATLEPHPPLTYAIFSAWGSTFGIQHEYILRLLPALSNLVGIAAMYALGAHLFDRRIGILAAFLWTVHPFQIWHAQDFRNYAIWASISVTTLWLGIRLLHRRRPIDWGLYAISATIAVLTFYTELLTVGALGLYGLLRYYRQSGFIRRWIGLHLGVVAVAAAAFVWLQGALFSRGAYGGTTGTGLDPLRLITQFLPTLAFGETIPPEYTLYIGISILLILLLALGWMTRHVKQHALLIGLIAFVPMVALSGVSLVMDIFIPRYMMNAIPAYLLLVAYASLRLRPRVLGIGILAIWLALTGVSLHTYYTDYDKSPAWRTLVNYLEQQTNTDDTIIQLGVDSGLGYYYQFADIDAREEALPQNPQQPADAITHRLDTLAADSNTLWLVGQTFPAWQNAGVVEDWAADNMQLVRSANISGLPVLAYKSWQVADDEYTPEAVVTFGDQIDLLDARVMTSDVTEQIVVWVYWRPRRQSDAPLTAFVHLIGNTNPATGTPLWAQDDHPPQPSRLTTATWTPDTVYRGVFTLPVDAVPAGDYTLLTGFYEPQSGDRLTINTGQDTALIDSITLPNQ